MRATSLQATDTIEVADMVRTLKQQWRAILSFLGLGIAGAVAIILLAPKRYDGRATVLVRTNAGGGASVLGRMTGIGDLLGGVAGLGGASGMETELQMLKSRALAGAIVDSLRLQVRVRDPRGTPPVAVVQSYRLQPSFGKRDYEFVSAGDGSYRIAGGSQSARPGQSLELDIGSLTLAATGLPARFTIRVLDREDAISLFARRLDVRKAGGDIARVDYRAEDSLTAGAAPNALVGFYLDRRRTVDRGSNQRRVEYVTAQVDSTARQLSQAERDLRLSQERSQVYDAEVADKANVESAAKLRESLIDLEVRERSLAQLLAQSDAGTLTSRDLAAYPAFMGGSAVSPLITQLTELENQRMRLLERRTERDPEVLVIDSNIRNVNATIVGLAKSYAGSTTKQRVELQGRLDQLQREILALPAAGERVGRLQRDVLRLTQLYTALQAQLVEARLGAITEGGEVRQVDVAVVPRTPAFPNPILTMGIGVTAGLTAGMVAALFLGWFGRWLRDPIEIERAVGISAERLAPNTPLYVAGTSTQRTVLVVPLDDRAQSRAVAERIARTASTRAIPVTMHDLTNGRLLAAGETSVARNLEQLEQQDGILVVELPSLSSEATIAALRETRPVLLVAGPGPVDRNRLASAVETLRRMNVPCAGIVLSDGARASDVQPQKHVT